MIGELRQVNCRLTPDLINKVDALAATAGRTRNDVFRLLIAKAEPSDIPPAWTESARIEREMLAGRTA